MYGNRLNLMWCGWPIALRSAGLAGVLLCLLFAVGVRADGGGEATEAGQSAQLLAMVGDDELPTAERKAAAVTLLDHEEADAQEVLAAVLPLFDVVDSAGRRELGERLARRGSDELVQTLIEIAHDREASRPTRQGAVAALGRHREQQAAGALVKLAVTSDDPVLRASAFAALATLTGRDDMGRDVKAWQAWWAAVEPLSESQWRQHLFESLAQQRRETRQYQQTLESRLVEAHRSLFRAVSAEDRPGQLIRLLEDPLDVVRQLGMDLAVQRLVDDRGFDEPLRETLRKRLDDPSPAIRQRATLLLRDLADGPAADRVARRLADAVEDVEAVLRAELLMMSRLPRIEAVERSLALLNSPALRDEAAGAINAAVDADRLTYQQGVRALRHVRGQLDAGQPPLPSIVLLLGRLGDEQDWRRIESWLDSEDDAVKQAAARAWADSDRPLLPLVERAYDARIESIALLTAARRGQSTVTFQALVQFEPEGEQVTERWHRALEAMAGRVSGDVVLGAVRDLERRGASSSLCRRMLAAALEQVEASSRSNASGQRVDLLLARGRLRIAAGEPEGALADFDRLARLEVELTDAQHEQRQRGIIRARIDLHQIDRAIETAEAMLNGRLAADHETDDEAADGGEGPASGLRENDSPMDLLFAAADERAAADDVDALKQLVEGIRRLTGASPNSGISQRIEQLEARLSQLRGDGDEGRVEPTEVDAEPTDVEADAA
ncbi:HEAT repeat domain-containing protein [Phycisphaerales bacterium AB-hyl4]|uniref:HEAT repeat domain-containing protein n=1 Tax=Natronomicrosphaera hydrolytica TaxID=3242702 RepID=A0ABV4U592_9BACT